MAPATSYYKIGVTTSVISVINSQSQRRVEMALDPGGISISNLCYKIGGLWKLWLNKNTSQQRGVFLLS